MEPLTRKRKLTEIDKNIPFFHSSVSSLSVKEESGNVDLKLLKLQKSITPSKKYEKNNQSFSKDVGEEFENSKLQRSNSRKYDTPNKSILRCHMKSCDRRYRKIIYGNATCSSASNSDGKIELKEKGLFVDVIQPKQLEISDLSQCNINFDHEKQNNETKLSLVNDTEARELRMWFACDYFEDIIAHELQKEKQYKLSDDFCKKFDVSPCRRKNLIGWLISVQVQLNAGNDTLHLAVNLLDILLDKMYIPYEFHQVSAIAAFWVAYKFIHGNLNVNTLLDLCAGMSTKDIVLNHEILVLQSSQLLQAGGDMSVFFNYLLFKLYGKKFPPEIYYCGQYFLEIMLIQFVFVDCLSCEKAITAIYTSLSVFQSPLRFELLEYTHFIDIDKLKHMFLYLTKYLRHMYSDEEELKNSCLYNKYKSNRYFKISTHKAFFQSKVQEFEVERHHSKKNFVGGYY